MANFKNQSSHNLTAEIHTPELTPQKRKMHLQQLFKQINPDLLGSEYSDAVKKNNEMAAIKSIAHYYRSREDILSSTSVDSVIADATIADAAICGEMNEINIPWKFSSGRINFLFDPTALKPPRNYEWVWQLNRHSYWRHMAGCYAKTGKNEYAQAFNTQLRDWISQTDCSASWNAPGSAWRTIDTGLRLMYSWREAFNIFRKSTDFSDENLCLMLASMHRQALHLMAHRTDGNWLLIEMSGAYTFAAEFPEFLRSEGIRRKAAAIMCRAIDRQILPDGLHDELSPDYHSVALSCGINVFEMAKLYGHVSDLPDAFSQMLERAANACLAMSTPGFTQPRTNDCFTMHTSKVLHKTGYLFPKRPEFQWLLNQRLTGSPPAGTTASRFLPWGGFAVMRSDWGSDAVYCCFDIGPLGMAHCHQDKLNINIYKGSEELIFDDGGGQYEISPIRSYAVSAANHNTVMVDSMGQTRSFPKRVNKPIKAQWISTVEFDYARGVYNGEFGNEYAKPARHTREVRFCKPDFFCVVDNLHSLDDKNHNYELLFHLDTLKVQKVLELPGALKTDFGKMYDILILPLFPENIQISTVSAQTAPRMAGWFVGRNDQNIHPATTVIMKAIAKRNFRFTTFLFPMKRDDCLPKIEELGKDCFNVFFKGRIVKLNLKNMRH